MGDVHHDWDTLGPSQEPTVDLRVNPRDLGEAGAVVDRELADHLRPRAVELVRDCEDDLLTFGPRFTTSSVYAMRGTYQDALAQTLDNVRAYVTASQILIEAMQKIQSGYDSTDGATSGTFDGAVKAAMERAMGALAYENVQQANQYVSDVPDGSWDGKL
ncbi:hypothetical protein [Luedemannella helvata]|uniref:Uncharacterized protein n=1 Tax=Luedemannella helvata TaxID=349315 RepID=A0ABN2KE14_9ACTN